MELIKKLKDIKSSNSVYHVKVIYRGFKSENAVNDHEALAIKLKSKTIFRGMSKAPNGNLFTKFTEPEKKKLAQELGTEVEKLNPFHPDNYWRQHTVKVDSTGLSLDLTTVQGLTQYLILKSYPNIAIEGTSNISKFPGATILMYSKDEDLTEEVTIADIRFEAMGLVKEAEGTPRKIREMATVYTYLNERGKKLGKELTTEYLKKYLTKMADKHPKLFLETFKNSDYTNQVFLIQALDCGAILKRNNAYYTKWDDKTPIAFSQESIMHYLADIVKNQDSIKQLELIVDEADKAKKI